MQNQDGWYIARDGQQVGPITEREMREFLRRGHLKSDDCVWRPGFDNWQRASDVGDLHVLRSPRKARAPAGIERTVQLGDVVPSADRSFQFQTEPPPVNRRARFGPLLQPLQYLSSALLLALRSHLRQAH